MKGLAVVINLKGGTAMGMTRDEVETAFRTRLGAKTRLHFAQGDDLPEVMEAAFGDESTDRVIVAGGDGTASLAAKHAIATDKPMGIVPLGTMNLFARTIDMPLDAEEAIDALADARERRVDYGLANDDVFINHVSLGFHPQLVRMRDSIPRGGRAKRMWNGMRVYLRLMAHHKRMRLTISGDFPPFGAKAGLAVVAVNPIQEGAAQIPRPDGQEDGQFGLYVSTHKSAWDLNKVVWRLLAGTLMESEHIAFRQTREVRIAGDSAFHVSRDGEIGVQHSPLECRIHPGGLRVLVPRGSAEDD